MFGGCSETRISVIVKHLHHIGIIKAFLSAWVDLLSSSVPEETDKIAVLWFVRGGSVSRLTLRIYFALANFYIVIFFRES